MSTNEKQKIINLLEGSISFENGGVRVNDQQLLRQSIYKLAEASAFGSGSEAGHARYFVRLIANALGIFPASINELYLARGRGEVPSTFTVPAINLRAMTFDAAGSVFRAAMAVDAAALIFEIARSEMNYTDQRPAEYVTSVLAAAIKEGYRGPVFIQGDHFQVSAKRFTANPDAEIQAVKDLIDEAVAAGFYNIDIDTSTLVDLTKSTVREQQYLNTSLSAMFTAYIRSLEPKGCFISIGGEIGEVGGHNSTEEELRAYMDGYIDELAKIAPNVCGISKISIQTGTSHGGVVLPDGTIAKVSVDFDTLQRLSRIARDEYGMGGAVQHGASTLPEDAFGKFVESEAVEVHLATNFQNMLFDRMPEDLRSRMYAYLDENSASERKPDMTAEQFYYKTRKNAIGPFKRDTWKMEPGKKEEISLAWEAQFLKLFKMLGLPGSRKHVEQTVKPVVVAPDLKTFLGDVQVEEDVSDLAD